MTEGVEGVWMLYGVIFGGGMRVVGGYLCFFVIV